MSERAGAKGLKDQECERGNRVRRPPIPYVPVVDEVQETLALKKERFETFTLPNNTKFKVRIWDAGTPEEFLNHIKEALNACERLGHFDAYKQALLQREKAKRNGKKQEEIISRFKAENIAASLIKAEREKLKGYIEEAKTAEKNREEAAENFFSVYANTLLRRGTRRLGQDRLGTGWNSLVDRPQGSQAHESAIEVRESIPRMYCPPSSDSLQGRRGGAAAALLEQYCQEAPASFYLLFLHACRTTQWVHQVPANGARQLPGCGYFKSSCAL